MISPAFPPEKGVQLVEVELDGVVIEACPVSGGIWFDNFELKKFDEAHEMMGAELYDLPRDDTAQVDTKRKRNCPKCDSLILMRHFFGAHRKVEIDRCPGCNGVWLDHGELQAIHEVYPTEADKRNAAEVMAQEMFGQQLADMKADSEATRREIQRVYGFLKYISPRFYIEGEE